MNPTAPTSIVDTARYELFTNGSRNELVARFFIKALVAVGYWQLAR